MAGLCVCEEKIANGMSYVNIDIVSGELFVKGQDLAGYEYEYSYNFTEDETNKLVKKLSEATGNKPDTDEIKLIMIRDFFGEGLDFCQHMRDYCDENNIKYKTFTWVA